MNLSMKRQQGGRLTRMNKVDLSILRLAVYEMKWDEDVPVRSCDQRGSRTGEDDSVRKKAPSFVNGVLGKIARYTGRGGRHEKCLYGEAG